MDEERSGSDLRRPLLEHHHEQDPVDEEHAAAILEEWNASVAAFVADNGGDDNRSCYCPSIDPDISYDRTLHDEEEEPGHPDATLDEDERHELHENAANNSSSSSSSNSGSWAAMLAKRWTTPLLPDVEPTLGTYSVGSATLGVDVDVDESRQPRKLVDGVAVVKFLKFVGLTFGAIGVVRWVVVAVGIADRDTMLTYHEIYKYEGDVIWRDLAVFFVLGRLHHRSGVDTPEWMAFGLVANLYFESQAYIPWMQHAATPYEMHCQWPWQLWVFAVLVVVGAVVIGLAHARVAHQQGRLWIAAGELVVCVVAFILPVADDEYAHFHHWFAGWFLGMHANLHDKWWSRATMAYCWGMYVNGIAVYGRDPLLTCEYARFLANDQNCPTEMEASTAMHGMPTVPFLEELFSIWEDPPDWRNCSSSGYHP